MALNRKNALFAGTTREQRMGWIAGVTYPWCRLEDIFQNKPDVIELALIADDLRQAARFRRTCEERAGLGEDAAVYRGNDRCCE
ncbi:hypothetical protein C3Y90_23840 [Rhizobium sp. UPM1134]|nr:hypothetical protein [Rhizobium ruizarguesonis]